MEIPKKAWDSYVKKQTLIQQTAAAEMKQYLVKGGGSAAFNALEDAGDSVQWVAYKLIERGDKVTKIPINPHSGKYASVSDSSTWGTLADAQKAVSRYKADGIGFVLTHGYFGIDLDNVIDAKTGTIKAFAQNIIDAMGSYTELSPSGRGIHIIAKGSPNFPTNRNGSIEMYSGGRYFTVTGRLFGSVKTIAERTEQAEEVWEKYLKNLPALSSEVVSAREALTIGRNMSGATVYAYGLATKYGEASAALSAQMYDEIAALEGQYPPSALPAATADYQTVAKTVQGVAKQSQNTDMMANAIGRLVKQAGADTTLQNALRDGAEFAWIPSGDTCAFCLTLASRGWQRASKKTIKGGHAEHIHSNCNCAYAIRFDSATRVRGYDPEKYLAMYEGADGSTPKARINAMRRKFYAENSERINAQKRSAYAKRRERESSAAEEFDV